MRVDGKGIIARDVPVRFTFDGRSYLGLEGDTLASALLANNHRLMGRSFKYHRPRGVLTAGSEEPNALVTTGQGGLQTPNQRATMLEIHDGLVAKSQNRWPSLGFDLMGVNDLLSPFLGAGFYYKTFMWPRSFWEGLYEPLIRRAAGLGALSEDHDATLTEKAFAFCDLLVIGAGPAGLMAALTAARAGADVILATEDWQTGGRLLSEDEEFGGISGAVWARNVTAELESLQNVRLMRRTTVTGVYDTNTYGALERVARHRTPRPGEPVECFWRIVAKRAVLASGAHERMIAFPGNDRPGVMTASAARTYLNRYGVAPGKAIAVFGNNDDAWKTARDFAKAGVRVTGLIDSRESVTPEGDFPIFTGAEVVATKGRTGIYEVTLRQGDRLTRITADCLAVSGGWNPALHLTSHLGAKPIWNDTIAAFVPAPDSVPGLEVAGAAAGVFSSKGALKSGFLRAKISLEALGLKAPRVATPETGDRDPVMVPLWQVKAKGRAFLDMANDVTTKDINLAASEGFASPEHMKRYTTQGMAPDQGKMSNVAAMAVLAEATGKGMGETGTTTFRPPYTPVTIAAMGAGGRAKGFAPERFMTSHQASLERRAPMIEAGLWYRPSYFPKPGEATWREACDREVLMVRRSVGVTDVSTLGKIDIQGKDAGDFLDFVYTNTMSTLAVGRARYGLMLREDGYVMDDGTCARLGPERFVISTTTGAAGLVMKHLDHAAQVLRPDLDVRIISVTEHWAQFAIAGPLARELLNAFADQPVTDDAFPFMSVGQITVSGVAARLFRISFSGERGYELAVPARYGDSLFRLLVAQAEVMGGGAYGLEALNVLRIEKGFITHAEIHGRTTAYDIGLQGMVSQKKDCIGKVMSEREGLMEDREELVGLQPVDGRTLLSAGAHLFNVGTESVRVNDQGYVTSVCWSPTLRVPLAMGFLKNGRARMGETLRLVDHLRGLDVAVTVGDAVVFDPTGGRARGQAD
jgi:methylglutamate dehydrogenase subunit C